MLSDRGKVKSRRSSAGFSTEKALGLAIGAVLALSFLWLASLFDFEGPRNDLPPFHRWVIWQANGPVRREPFGSEAECEQARKKFVVEHEKDLESRAKKMAQLGIREAIERGESPQELLGEATRLDLAYCRRID